MLEKERNRKLVLRFFKAEPAEITADRDYIVTKSFKEAKEAALKAFCGIFKNYAVYKKALLDEKIYCAYCNARLYGRANFFISKLKLYEQPPAEAKKDLKIKKAKGYGVTADCHLLCHKCGLDKKAKTGFLYYG